MKVTGKADWGLAYGARSLVAQPLVGARGEIANGNAMVVIEAKSRAQFSSAGAQLLTYLAIMHQLRKQNKKPNAVVQGFYSDGWLYEFMAIDTNGVVLSSDIVNCQSTRDYDLIFSWIVALLYSAAKSSPMTSPTKYDVTRQKEIQE